ncbi:hypothetical protein FQA39_LY14388 [Lamprigera yunnana]|nr:hypothetical protein FQA39_LY14388 [Lamprigera yunnana]
MTNFEFNAPKYCDFINSPNNECVETIESYFEFEHEGPLAAEYEDISDIEPLHDSFRRFYSLSAINDIPLEEILAGDEQSKENGAQKCLSEYGSISNLNDSTLKTSLNSKSLQSLNNQPKKFISIAEAVKQFHMKTPERYHTKSHNAKVVINNIPVFKQSTLPLSPLLATKNRSRPTTVLSWEDRELQEFEKMKKFKIKAQPLNSKILLGPTKPPSTYKKPPTKSEPFNLTIMPVKKPPTPVKPPQFRAQPVPAHVKENVNPIIKRSVQSKVTVFHTPNLLKRLEDKHKEDKMTDATEKQKISATPTSSGNSKVENAKLQALKETVSQQKQKKPVRLTTTQLMPFSFEERDQNLRNKKLQVLKEIEEEEKKNREFYAKPMPKKIYSSSETLKSVSSYTKRQNSLDSLKTSSSDCSELQPIFKAKPAKVLQMKPFEPKKQDHTIEVLEFTLHTEHRAKARDIFEQKLRKQEEETEKYRKLTDDEKLQQDREEIAKLRKEAELKAHPIRKYKAVKSILPKVLTVPEINWKSNEAPQESQTYRKRVETPQTTISNSTFTINQQTKS